MDKIALAPPLGNPGYAFLTAAAGAFSDMAGLPNAALLAADAIGAVTVTKDASPPTILWADLDMTAGILTMRINEPVQGSSINYSSLVIQSDPAGTVQVRLTDPGTGSSLPNTVLLELAIDPDDLIRIKAASALASSIETTWLKVDEGAILNMAGVKMAAAAPEQIRNLEFDTTPPTIDTFVVDLDGNALTLQASEPLDVADLRVACIALSSDGGRSRFVNLTGDEGITRNGSSVTIGFLKADSDALKLANFTGEAYLTASCSLTTDTNDNALAPFAALAGTIKGDTTKPTLKSWSISMDDGLASFIFDEPMSIASLKAYLFNVLGLPSPTADEQALGEAP
jgi:hypothetical protein